MTKPAKPDAFAIAATLNQISTNPPSLAQTGQDNIPPAKAGRKPKTPRSDTAAKSTVAPSRQGARFIGGYFPEATHKALRMTMAEEDTTIQALMEEAIADLLVKKGKTKHLG